MPFVESPFLQQLGLTGAIPSIFPGGYTQSLNNVANGIFPTVQLGVQMSLPIRNRTAAAQVAVRAPKENAWLRSSSWLRWRWKPMFVTRSSLQSRRDPD